MSDDAQIFPWQKLRYLAQNAGVDSTSFWSMTPAELQSCLSDGQEKDASVMTRQSFQELIQLYPDTLNTLEKKNDR